MFHAKSGVGLAPRKQLEPAILTMGLYLRGLWIARHPKRYALIPPYMNDFPLAWEYYEAALDAVVELINPIREMYVPLPYPVIRQLY